MDSTSQDCIKENGTVIKHGFGKGLMTVWRVMNPNRRDVSPCVDLLDERATLPQSSARNPPHQKKKQRQLASILVFVTYLILHNYDPFSFFCLFLLNF